LPVWIDQFKAQYEADLPHSLLVAKFLMATDEATRKVIAAIAKQGGRVWSEDRIQKLSQCYRDNLEFQQKVNEIAKTAST